MDLLRQLMRVPLLQGLWTRFPVGSLSSRMRFGIFDYPSYAYGVYMAGQLARCLELTSISAIEFGVAGGRGLLALERIAVEVEKEMGVRIDVLGFDNGKGLPPTTDYRDLPHVWGEGYFPMDQEQLRRRLTRARLILGDVAETVPEVVRSGALSPVGFAAFDLDYYSSTRAAFAIFEGEPATRLPRVHCYFDDTIGPQLACMNPYVGELLAIEEYNQRHAHQKISQVINLRLSRDKPERWNEQIFVHHDFEHPLYTRNVMPKQRGGWGELPL
jgi:hypothetical protein